MLVEAIELVVGFIAIEYPAGHGSILWLVGLPDLVSRGKRPAVKTRLV